MAFYESRCFYYLLNLQNSGVESFHMTYLEEEIAFFREPEQFSSVRYIVRYRFFNQEMISPLHQLSGDFIVPVGRNYHTDSFDRGGDVFQFSKREAVILLRDFLGTLSIRIQNSDQLYPGKFRIDPGMSGTQMTYSDYNNFNQVHYAIFSERLLLS